MRAFWFFRTFGTQAYVGSEWQSKTNSSLPGGFPLPKNDARRKSRRGTVTGYRTGQTFRSAAVKGMRRGLAFFGSKRDNLWVLIDEVVFVFFRTDRFPWGPRATRNAGPHQG